MIPWRVVQLALVLVTLLEPSRAPAAPEARAPAAPEAGGLEEGVAEAPAALPAGAAEDPAADPSLAPVPAAPPAAEPEPVSSEALLLDAWAQPGSDLAARVVALRSSALRLGVRNLEGAARALLLDPGAGDPLARARAAVLLAPDLPDAHLALAGALWSEAGAPAAALDEVGEAVTALRRHLEASLWLRATLLYALAHAAILGSLLFLLAAALATAPRAVQPLLRAVPAFPAVGAFALLAALLLLPAALGEGSVGVAGAALLPAFGFGRARERLCVALAAALLLAGLYPLSDWTGSALAAPGADPTAEAAAAAEAGLPSALDRLRLERAGADDPLAARALALLARRSGALEQAEAGFAALLREGGDATLLNNAANVRLLSGRHREAVELYLAASAAAPLPEIYFNLSQAYGRMIRLEEQDQSLAQAQALDPDAVQDLVEGMGALGSMTVVDLPLPAASVRARLDAAVRGSASGAWLRQRFAPGWLGSSLLFAAAAFGLLGVLALGVGARLGAGADGGDDDFSGGFTRLQGRAATDPALRMARIATLRERRAREVRVARILSLLVPGSAGILGRRPMLGLAAALLFALALEAAAARSGVVPDPLAAGAVVALLCSVTAGAAALLYVALTGAVMLLRDRS